MGPSKLDAGSITSSRIMFYSEGGYIPARPPAPDITTLQAEHRILLKQHEKLAQQNSALHLRLAEMERTVALLLEDRLGLD